MSAEAIAGSMEQAAEIQEVAETRHWSLGTRIAFRFAFVYLSLYTLTFPAGSFIPIPYTDFLIELPFRFWTSFVPWVSQHILRICHPVVFTPTGSSDKVYDWVQLLCIVVITTVATMVWSVLDRKRENYIGIYKWFRIWIRFALAATMIQYGMMKLIPYQMPTPNFHRLLEPFGQASPMGMLWAFMGTSKAYEIFSGCVEVLGGILLVFPRTAALGAFVTMAAAIQVFTLNMCFDVPAKIFAFHPFLMAAFLAAPEVPKLANVLLLNRRVEPAPVPPLFQRRWLNVAALVLQIALGVYLTATYFNQMAQGYKMYGDGAPKSPLYGIWMVDDFKVDGETRPPLLTDSLRWRRVLLENPASFVYQQMDDKLESYSLQLDSEKKTMALEKYQDKNWKAQLTFDRPAPDRLILQGQIDGHQIQAQLTQFDLSKYLLISRGFHWVQEHPFNR